MSGRTTPAEEFTAAGEQLYSRGLAQEREARVARQVEAARSQGVDVPRGELIALRRRATEAMFLELLEVE